MSCEQTDGTTPQLPCSYSLTWTAMCSTSLLWLRRRGEQRELVGLVGTLTDHYGSPGRLADYRRQFERMAHTAGEDPSIFAIKLETLAVKAFGDMGQTARLRIIPPIHT